MEKGHNFIVAITGKSGAGKDVVARGLCERFDMEFVVSTTSRPIRTNEVEGEDYHFVSSDEFQELIDTDKLVEHRRYYTIQGSQPQVWDYGIKRSDINLSDGSYVCVVDLEGLSHLQEEFGDKVISVYIDAKDEIRVKRARNRDKNFDLVEFSRRLGDDFLKFYNVREAVDVIVENNGELQDCIDGVSFHVDYAIRLMTFYSQYASY